MTEKKQEFRVDFHVHSEASPDGLSSLDELAKAAKAAGLDAIAIADHNRFALEKPEEREGVLLLPACEVSTQSGHVLALFCDTPFDPSKLTGDGVSVLPTAKRAIVEIHAHGGLAVIAHPYEKKDRELSGLETQLDGVEAANSRARFHNPEANAMAEAYAKAHGLPMLGGSDAHSAKAVGNAYTVVAAEAPADFRDAVKSGRCRPVYVRDTPRVQKGFSQMEKAKRSGSPYLVLRGAAYIAYCFLRDLLPQARKG